MKVAISASGPDLDSVIDQRFGRCAYLIIADTETLEFEALENPNVMAGGGAGISTAQTVIDKGVEAVVTGNVGPNAYGVLNQAGIPIYTGASGPIRQALEALKGGALSSTGSATVGGHFGMQPPGGGGAPGTGPAPGAPGQPMGPGMGGGPGTGGGPGMGGGGGRGGGGRGMGGGGGRGGGRGRGRW